MAGFISQGHDGNNAVYLQGYVVIYGGMPRNQGISWT